MKILGHAYEAIEIGHATSFHAMSMNHGAQFNHAQLNSAMSCHVSLYVL